MSEKEELFRELKKLSKRANQRILRLERLTGLKEPFATKQLMDYLSVEDAVSKKGRVRVTMKFNENQMINIIKATKEFLSDDSISRVSQAKALKKQVEKSLDTEITWEIASGQMPGVIVVSLLMWHLKPTWSRISSALSATRESR